MSATLAIARRELRSYLFSPVGPIIIAVFVFFTALVYFAAAPLLVGGGFSDGQPASLRLFFEIGAWVFFFIAPAVSMRTVSEELRSGTIEMLLTAPVSEFQVIFGKFAGAFGFLALMLVPTAVFVFALEQFGRPDYGEVACGYLGLLLVGAACLSSGILASTLTSSQMMAYLTTIFFWLILLLATVVLPRLAPLAESLAARPENGPWLDVLLPRVDTVAGILASANPLTRMRGFIIGLVDTFNIVYFLSFTVVFLVAATRALAARRWP